MAHAAAAAIKAGTDLECGFGQGQAFLALPQAVHENLITEAGTSTPRSTVSFARASGSVRRPTDSYAYGRIPFSEDNSPAHRALSLQSARESMVLLKNADHTLPLKGGHSQNRRGGPEARTRAVAAGQLQRPATGACLTA